MSRSRHSDTSWRQWGEERKQRSLLKDFEDWKNRVQEEMEDMMTGESVYIIVNEWIPKNSDAEISEIIDSQYFDSEDEAWEALLLIAESYQIDLPFEETSFDLPETDQLLKQSYFIQELNHG